MATYIFADVHWSCASDRVCSHVCEWVVRAALRASLYNLEPKSQGTLTAPFFLGDVDRCFPLTLCVGTTGLRV